MKNTLCLFLALMFSGVTMHGQSAINWSVGKDLAPASSGNEHPRMVVGRSGNPLVVWHHSSRCMFSRWDGTGFTAPVLLNPPSISVAGASWMGPDIAAHGDTVYAVFKQIPESSADAHIYCVRSFDGGISFSSPVRVDYIADSLSRFPSVTTDDLGNPIVGFMKFDPGFGNSRWAVTRSVDFGSTFSTDVKASGWSNANSVICDCCPGAVTCSGNTVAMVYRDNNSNIRDTWAGISTNNGAGFSGGINVDQQNWQIFACPATGPDGVIIGDSLYTTFANGASGKSLVYYNATPLSAMNSPVSLPLTGVISGLSQQNYPRIATDGKALAIAWMQVVNGSRQCVLRFTSNKDTGLPPAYEVVDLNNNTNCDLAISQGNLYVVWEDDNAGTIQYRVGTFTPTSGTQEYLARNVVSVFPNPTASIVSISSGASIEKVLVTNSMGEVVTQAMPNSNSFSLDLAKEGLYFVCVTTDQGQTTVEKLMITR